MSLVLASCIRHINSFSFRTSFHVANKVSGIRREVHNMDKETNTDSEPVAKKPKIMPTETTNGTTNGINGHDDKKSKVLMFHKLSEDATTPSRGSEHAVGFDLYSAKPYDIPPQGKEMVDTDIQIMLPEGCYGRVAPRSGLAAKKHIDVGAGVIDRDYRGPVRVVMFNHSQESFVVNKGDRVAQLICEKAYIPELVESKEELPKTVRGAGGFGSTGGVKSMKESKVSETPSETPTEEKAN